MITTVVLSVALVLIILPIAYLVVKQSEILTKLTQFEKTHSSDKAVLKKISKELKSTKRFLKKQSLAKDSYGKGNRHILSKETVKDLIGDLESEGLLKKDETRSAKDIIIIQEFIHHGDDGETDVEEMTVILDEARELIKTTGVASITHLGKTLAISNEDAELILDRLEEEGIVGPSDGSSHRSVFERE